MSEWPTGDGSASLLRTNEGSKFAANQSIENLVSAPGNIVKKHLPTLDGLRGMAVLLVMVYHFVSFIDPTRLGNPLLHSLSSIGWVGVEIFFVLSGFLITGILLESKGSKHYFRNFYIRRVLRIFPLYYAVIGVVAGYCIVSYWLTRHSPISMLPQLWLWIYCSNIPMMQSGTVFVSDNFSIGHFWSLAIEEHFYLVWPLVVYKCSANRLCRVTLIIFVAAAVLRVMLYPLIGSRGVYHFTLCRVDGLVLGAFLAALFRESGPSASVLKIARSILLTSLVGLAVIAFWRNGLHPYDRASQAFGYTLIALTSGGILIEAVWGKPSGLIQRALMARSMRFLGLYSYGIYVFHGLLRPTFAAMIPYFDARMGSYVLASTLYLGISIACSVILAVVSYHLYELRFLRLKSRFGYRT